MTVLDSSAIIPLARTGNLELVKKTLQSPKTTQHIYQETVGQGKGKPGTSEIEKAFKNWIEIKKVKEDIKETAELEGIQKADVAVINLAKKKKEPLLANDKALIQVARSKGVKCYWVTTLILKSIKEKTVSKEKGKNILYQLVDKGMNLKPQVYTTILKEIDHLQV